MPQPIMKGAIEHDLVQKVMNYQLAIAQGEIESARTVFHEDVIYILEFRLRETRKKEPDRI